MYVLIYTILYYARGHGFLKILLGKLIRIFFLEKKTANCDEQKCGNLHYNQILVDKSLDFGTFSKESLRWV